MNTEVIFVLIFTGFSIHLLISMMVKLYKSKMKDRNKPNKIMKFFIKRKESYEWNDLIRQIHVFYYSLSIYSFLQINSLHFTSLLEAVNSIVAISIGIFMIIFPYLITRLPKLPSSSEYIVIKEERNIFRFYKKDAYYFEAIILYRKLLYSLSLVIS